jgi:hypothetical protein
VIVQLYIIFKTKCPGTESAVQYTVQNSTFCTVQCTVLQGHLNCLLPLQADALLALGLDKE